MDETGGHDAKWNKAVTKKQILHDSTHLRICIFTRSSGDSFEQEGANLGHIWAQSPWVP